MLGEPDGYRKQKLVFKCLHNILLTLRPAQRQQFKKYLGYMWMSFTDWFQAVVSQRGSRNCSGNGSTGACHFSWSPSAKLAHCRQAPVLMLSIYLADTINPASALPCRPAPLSLPALAGEPAKQLPPCHTWRAVPARTSIPQNQLLSPRRGKRPTSHNGMPPAV